MNVEMTILCVLAGPGYIGFSEIARERAGDGKKGVTVVDVAADPTHSFMGNDISRQILNLLSGITTDKLTVFSGQ